MRRVLLPLLLSVAVTPGVAAGQRIEQSSIEPTFTGATVHIDTPLSAKVEVVYGPGGQLTGDAGGVAFHLGSQNDRGRWWAESGKLCHKWRKWFEAETICLTLRQDRQRLFWRRDDGTTGTATIVAKAEPPPPPQAPPPAIVAATTKQPGAIETMPAQAAPPPAPAKVAAAAAKPAVPVTRSAAKAPPALAAKSAKAAEPRPPMPAPTDAISGSASSVASAALGSFVHPAPFRVIGLSTDDALNVRNGPGPSYAPVGALRPGARGVQLLGSCVVGWCQVRHGETFGWVNGSYLAEESTAEQAVQRVSTASRVQGGPRLVSTPRLLTEGYLYSRAP